MFYCGAPFLTIIVCLVLWKIADISENREIRKALMKAGVKKEDITITGNIVTYKMPRSVESVETDN